MSKKVDVNTIAKVTKWVARAHRASLMASNYALPKDQRDFHTGRVEGYLQVIADMADCPVKDIRSAFESSRKSAE